MQENELNSGFLSWQHNKDKRWQNRPEFIAAETRYWRGDVIGVFFVVVLQV